MEPNSAQLFDVQDTQPIPKNTITNLQSDTNDMLSAFNDINQKNDAIPVNIESAKQEEENKAEEEEFKFANTNMESKKLIPKQEAFEPYVML